MPIFQQKFFGTAETFGKKFAVASATMIAVTIVGAATALPSQAQFTPTGTLLNYAFSSATQFNPSVQDPSIMTATPDGSHLSNSNIKMDGESNDNDLGSINLEPYANATTDIAATTVQDTYYSLTITAAPHTILDLSSISFDVAPGGNPGPRGYDVYAGTDVSGYGVPATLPTNEIMSGNYATTPTGTARTFTTVSSDLSGNANLQNITSVQFRFYVYAPSQTSSIDIRNLFITGSSDVMPEPSAFALALPGIAILGSVVARRRRRSL